MALIYKYRINKYFYYSNFIEDSTKKLIFNICLFSSIYMIKYVFRNLESNDEDMIELIEEDLNNDNEMIIEENEINLSDKDKVLKF